jgi:hypothetical protein
MDKEWIKDIQQLEIELFIKYWSCGTDRPHDSSTGHMITGHMTTGHMTAP